MDTDEITSSLSRLTENILKDYDSALNQLSSYNEMVSEDITDIIMRNNVMSVVVPLRGLEYVLIIENPRLYRPRELVVRSQTEKQPTGRESHLEYDNVCDINNEIKDIDSGIVKRARRSFRYHYTDELRKGKNGNPLSLCLCTASQGSQCIQASNLHLTGNHVNHVYEFRRITPEIARLSGMNYSAEVRVDVRYCILEYDEKKHMQTLMERVKALRRKHHGRGFVANVLNERRIIRDELFRSHLLFYLPVMVGSNLCTTTSSLSPCVEGIYEHRGCFIQKGLYRTIPPLLQMSHNTPVVQRDSSKYTARLELRSRHESRRHYSTSTLVLKAIRNNTRKVKGEVQVVACIPFVKRAVPVAVLFVALGLDVSQLELPIRIAAGSRYHEDKISLIVEGMKLSLNVKSQEEALLLISKACDTPGSKTRYSITDHIKHARTTLSYEFLPHLGHEMDDLTKKTLYLGYLVWKLLLVACGIETPDNRDHLENQRLESCGSLISILIRQLYSKYVQRIGHTYFDKLIRQTGFDGRIECKQITEILGETRMTSRINYCMATGNWGVFKGTGVRKNVSQQLSCQNPLSVRSHLGRISTTANSEVKFVDRRQIDSSTYGYICPNETPEGKQVGLVTHSTLGTYHSMSGSTEVVIDILSEFTLEMNLIPVTNWKEWVDKQGTSTFDGMAKIFVSGRMVGWTPTPLKTVELLKRLKRSQWLDPFIGVRHCHKENKISIRCDNGRLMRPLFLVQQGRRLNECVREGQLGNLFANPYELRCQRFYEYLDSLSENDPAFPIALDGADLSQRERDNGVKISYQEIDPCFSLGLSAGMIPYLNCNQSPRNTYSAAMGKQHCGINFDRTDLKLNRQELHYPQRPLSETMTSRSLYNGELRFSGQTPVVAICTVQGFNMEDAFLMNRQSCERGLFTINNHRTFKDERRKQGSRYIDQYENPRAANCVKLKESDFTTIGSDGMPKLGSTISLGSILMGKSTRTTNLDRISKEERVVKTDSSMVFNGPGRGGFVTKVMCNDSSNLRKVEITSVRDTERGDKFASMHAQKGTVSVMIDEWDCPRTKDGRTPDLIISPFAFPSRMTIAQLKEMLFSLCVSYFGYDARSLDRRLCHFNDSTPFRDDRQKLEMARRMLQEIGLSAYGKESMWCGRTGTRMKFDIFMAPLQTLRLKHMVVDKIHSRSEGPVEFTTRQPVEGRSKSGGLKFGEMEREALIGYAAPLSLCERMKTESDHMPYMIVCAKCGLMAINHVDPERGSYCTLCETNQFIRRVDTIHAFKKLLHILLAFGIKPMLILEDAEALALGDVEV